MSTADKIKVAVSGVNGKMGSIIAQTVDDDPHCQLTTTTIRPGKKLTHWDLGIHESVAVVNNLRMSCEFQVVIDMTAPELTMQNVADCISLNKPLIIGTTGLEESQVKQIESAATQIPIVFAANMSLGVNLCYDLLAKLAAHIDENWQVAVHDTHHRLKIDSPSGTALTMGELIAKIAKIPTSTIQYSSMRLGDVPAESSAIFAHDGERIEITHKATSRKTFAYGAVAAAKWLVNRPPGLYSMQHVMGLR